VSIKVNGVEITDDEVAAELPFHQEPPQPLRSACIALALKRVMLDEAAELGPPVGDAEEARRGRAAASEIATVTVVVGTDRHRTRLDQCHQRNR